MSLAYRMWFMVCGRRKRKVSVGSEISASRSKFISLKNPKRLLIYICTGMRDSRELTWETSTGSLRNSWLLHLPSINPLLPLRHHLHCTPRCRPQSWLFERRTYRHHLRMYFHISHRGTSVLLSGSTRSCTLHPTSPLSVSIILT